jgi:hypothetical protein
VAAARGGRLTAEDKKRRSRLRNREHARNTRLRKKAYVEELKAALLGAVGERDKVASGGRGRDEREARERAVRGGAVGVLLEAWAAHGAGLDEVRARSEASAREWGCAVLDLVHDKLLLLHSPPPRPSNHLL